MERAHALYAAHAGFSRRQTLPSITVFKIVHRELFIDETSDDKE